MIYRVSIDENNADAEKVIRILNKLSEEYDFLNVEEEIGLKPELSSDEIKILDERYQDAINHPENLTPWENFKEEMLAKL